MLQTDGLLSELPLKATCAAQHARRCGWEYFGCGFCVLSTASQPLWHLISSPELCLLQPAQGTKHAVSGQQGFPGQQHKGGPAWCHHSHRVRCDLTFVQFEDGVSHGRQHPLPFQDVDIPQPQGQGERGLFQTHEQIHKWDDETEPAAITASPCTKTHNRITFCKPGINLKHKNVFYHLWFCLKANELGWSGKYLKPIHECRKRRNFPHKHASTWIPLPWREHHHLSTL